MWCSVSTTLLTYRARAPYRNPAATGYIHGLDGLRAIAVLLVLVYHLWPELLPGGFLGVDVFFVISGFLITGLLYRELAAHGRISFRDFYVRRIRRLFPADDIAFVQDVVYIVGIIIFQMFRHLVFNDLAGVGSRTM